MKNLGLYHPVGSAYAKIWSAKDKDWVVFVEKANYDKYITWLGEEGFKPDSEHVYEGSEFSSWRKIGGGENINFIVTSDYKFFEKFILAAKICKNLNWLLDKSARIMIHEAIINGTYEKQHPLSSEDFGCEYLNVTQEDYAIMPF